MHCGHKFTMLRIGQNYGAVCKTRVDAPIVSHAHKAFRQLATEPQLKARGEVDRSLSYLSI